MGDHDHSPDAGGHLALPSNLTGLITRAIIAAIKSAGKPELADKIAKAPELIGTKLGDSIAALLHQKTKGHQLTQADISRVANAVKDDPDTARMLIDTDFLRLYGKNLVQTRRRVSKYREVLMRVCDQMAAARTSYALRGFVHAGGCISYWHIDGAQPALIGSDFLAPFDLKVFLLPKESSTGLIKTLNEIINQDQKKQLPVQVFELLSPNSIDLVTAISPAEPQGYSTITVEQLRHGKNQGYPQLTPNSDSFRLYRPMQTGTPNAPTTAMLDSLAEAEFAQQHKINLDFRLSDIFKKQ
jgi:hypothetical protein